MTPKVTVFIALYNAENYIKETIESVLNQTFNDYEILIINDGSTDNSVDVVNQFDDSRIRLLHNEKNSGERFTRHRALTEAIGKYIAVLDADDLALPNRLELQVDFLENNPNYVLCGGWAKCIDENGKLNNNLMTPKTANEEIKINMLFQNQFVNSSTMYLKDIGLKVGGYNGEDIPPDYDFFSKLTEKYNIANLPHYFILYRQHSNSISITNRAALRKGELNILSFLYEKFNLEESLLKVPHSFFTEDFSELKYNEIKIFFEKIISENKRNNYYSNEQFVEVVFNKWLKIVINKKNRKIALDFINNPIFDYKKLNFKEKRKIFKIVINPFR